MTEPVARVDDFSLSLVRNGIRSQVLTGIDLQIRAGEILGLVGESGSGKSVLALSLLGLLPQTSHPQTGGAVTVGGVNMLRARESELRRVRRELLGAIFQDPMTSLNPTMRIGRQIGERTHDDTESVRLLDTVGVRDAQLRLRVYPSQMSFPVFAFRFGPSVHETISNIGSTGACKTILDFGTKRAQKWIWS